jgi:hypothetical protein
MYRTLIAYIEMVQYSEGSPFNYEGSSPRMSVAHFFPRGTNFLLRVAGHVPSLPTRDDCFSAMKAAHEDARKTLWDKPKDLWTFRMERVGENEGGRSQVIPENGTSISSRRNLALINCRNSFICLLFLHGLVNYVIPYQHCNLCQRSLGVESYSTSSVREMCKFVT